MAVDFDDRMREIQDTAAAMLELGDVAGARSSRNPSIATVKQYTKYEVSMFTHYEDIKGDTKNAKIEVVWGVGCHPR